MSDLRLVIFDCDGTIVDSQHLIVEAMNGGLRANGLDAMPREKILSIVGLSLPLAQHGATGQPHPALGIDVDDLDRCFVALVEHVADLADPAILDLGDVEQALHAGQDLHVVDAVHQGRQIEDDGISVDDREASSLDAVDREVRRVE